jgi:hypothetical protein
MASEAAEKRVLLKGMASQAAEKVLEFFLGLNYEGSCVAMIGSSWESSVM